MMRSSALNRSVVAVLFALMLAMRLLSPAGFMPAFDHGSISIIVCPDAGLAPAPMTQHHDHGDAKLQQHCPYAAGGSPATASEIALVVAALLAAAALQLGGRELGFLHFSRPHERPPLRGPPAIA